MIFFCGAAGFQKMACKIFMVNDGDLDSDGVPDFAAFDEPRYTQIDNAGDKLPFIPVVLDLSAGVDISKTSISFDYRESTPEGIKGNNSGNDKGIRRTRTGTDPQGNPVYSYSAPAGFRLWTNRSGARDKQSIANSSGGNFIPANTKIPAEKFPFSGRVAELYIEAVPGAENIKDAFIAAQAEIETDNGKITVSDKVRVRPILMQFVAKGENGEIVPTDFIPVCNPRPEIKLDNVTPSHISVSENGQGYKAELELAAKMRYPLLDIVERKIPFLDNKARVMRNADDIAEVEVNWQEDSASRSFWRPYPVIGTIASGRHELLTANKEEPQTLRMTTISYDGPYSGHDEVVVKIRKMLLATDNKRGWETSVQPRGIGSDIGTYKPYTVRLTGLESWENFELRYKTTSYGKFVKIGDYHYPCTDVNDENAALFITVFDDLGQPSSHRRQRRLHRGAAGWRKVHP